MVCHMPPSDGGYLCKVSSRYRNNEVEAGTRNVDGRIVQHGCLWHFQCCGITRTPPVAAFRGAGS